MSLKSDITALEWEYHMRYSSLYIWEYIQRVYWHSGSMRVTRRVDESRSARRVLVTSVFAVDCHCSILIDTNMSHCPCCVKASQLARCISCRPLSLEETQRVYIVTSPRRPQQSTKRTVQERLSGMIITKQVARIYLFINAIHCWLKTRTRYCLFVVVGWVAGKGLWGWSGHAAPTQWTQHSLPPLL